MCISIHQYISSADILSYVVSWSSLYEMRTKRRYINFLIYNAWTIISSIRGKNEDQETTQMENMCISTHQYISPADILCCVVSLSSFYEMRIKRPYINYLIYNAWTIISSITGYLSIGKYDRGLTYIRRNVLHRLDVTDRVRFRVCI